MATIGHKYSRLDERRYTELGENKCYTLICHKCNQEEALIEQKKIPIDVLWDKSKAYPKNHPFAPTNELNKYKRDK